MCREGGDDGGGYGRRNMVSQAWTKDGRRHIDWRDIVGVDRVVAVQ